MEIQKKNYEVIVLDLDGTLTNRDKIITPRTKEALMEAQRRGKKIVLASGRPTGGVLPLAEELSLKDYGGFILSFNGGMIMNCRTKEIIFSRLLPEEANKKIIYLALVEPKVKASLGKNFSVYRSEPYFLEILPKGIDKAQSLERLLEVIGFTREEMIACGDGYNDLSMIQYAGLGVAMENAVFPVRKAADYITDSNNDDGVAKVVEKFMLFD